MSKHSQIRYDTEHFSTLELKRCLIISWTFRLRKIFELRKYLTLVWICKIILDLILLMVQKYDFVVEETYTTMSKHSQIRYVTELSLLWNFKIFDSFID